MLVLSFPSRDIGISGQIVLQTGVALNTGFSADLTVVARSRVANGHIILPMGNAVTVEFGRVFHIH